MPATKNRQYFWAHVFPCKPWCMCDWILCTKQTWDCRCFLISTENTGLCLIHSKPELELLKMPVFTLFSQCWVHRATHASPLSLHSGCCIPELKKQYEPFSHKSVSWGRAISTIEIASFKPWLSSLTWLYRFPSTLSWKDGAQGTLSFLKDVNVADNQTQNKHFSK